MIIIVVCVFSCVCLERRLLFTLSICNGLLWSRCPTVSRCALLCSCYLCQFLVDSCDSCLSFHFRFKFTFSTVAVSVSAEIASLLVTNNCSKLIDFVFFCSDVEQASLNRAGPAYPRSTLSRITGVVVCLVQYTQDRAARDL